MDLSNMNPLTQQIEDVIIQNGIGWSLEFYPPKTTESLLKLKQTINQIYNAVSQPPIMIDITYSAGSTTNTNNTTNANANAVYLNEIEKTLSLCEWVQTQLKVQSCPHMTIRGTTRENLCFYIDQIKHRGIKAIMALRGDNHINNMDPELVYAADLVKLIHQRVQPPLNILVASYPEGHPECHGHLEQDIAHLQHKIANGASVTITQFFLDSKIYLDFRKKLPSSLRVIPGIILLSSISGLHRMIQLTGGSITIPQSVNDELALIEQEQDTDPNQDRMREWGLRFACRLCQELYEEGERFFHIYTLNANETVCRLIAFINQLPKSNI